MTLREWIDKEGYGEATRLGRLLGAGDGVVRALADGRTRPRLDVALAVEAVTEGAVRAVPADWPGVGELREVAVRRLAVEQEATR